MNYSYLHNVALDVLTAIDNNYTEQEIISRLLEDREDFENELNDNLWIDDAVTGNASGSYFCNSYKAKEAIFSDTESVMEALTEFCCEDSEIGKHFKNGEWEQIDCITRCYYLGQAISIALDCIEIAIENGTTNIDAIRELVDNAA